MQTGSVIFFDVKGFGFLAPDDGSEERYFHVSALPGERGKRFILEGQKVQYELGTWRGKTVAKKVIPIEAEEQPTSETQVGNVQGN
jgi:CspA family cold shock protein